MKQFSTIDANTATAHVAYAFSEVSAIYPITPSSPMGELVDEWSAKDKKNMFGDTVSVIEMQSEGGVAGAVHGALSAGSLTTTFTSSQGLLLMLPNMFKIAGEMLPVVFHVAARSLAYQALSIFGDHSDVMAARTTGFAMLASSSVQEAMDMAIVSHLSTLEARIPFLHFFDGFRTSHEIQKIEIVDYQTIRSMVQEEYINNFRQSALSPDHPYMKAGSENPDVYFQGREASNKYYTALPGIIKKYLKVLKEKTGRAYNLYEYVGDKNAEKIIISMSSSCETIEETVKYLNKKGEKVGAVKVRLYRPFFVKDFIDCIPKTVKKIAVLDRTKESGSIGEPLYLDTVAALQERKDITIIGGRYGLSSKEFTPSMVKAVFDHLDGKSFHNFTVGIDDDVTHTSLKIEEIDIEDTSTTRCKFWGLGSDGTVGANKNSIKIIGENTDMYAQAYFSYDSKKSGSITISYLRFGKEKIQAPYLPAQYDFIALHNHSFIGKYDILEGIKENGIFLLNAPWKREEVWKHLTKEMQETILKKKIKVYAIDASSIAEEVGLGGKINTIMQAAFFIISGVLPEEKAISLIKNFIQKTYEKKGKEVVEMNFKAVDKTKEALVPVNVESNMNMESTFEVGSMFKKTMSIDPFITNVFEPTEKLKGNNIPVSHMPIDGKLPLGTTKLEKRGIATHIPHWISEKCIQCGICSFVCPHAAVRIKQIDPNDLKNKPSSFNTVLSKTKNERNLEFKVQVYPEDCTGCTLCAGACPTKALEMSLIEEERNKGENDNATFFEELPDNVLDGVPENSLKGTQLKKPLFEFSGACSGCGETPYIKLLTQLFGDRMIIANATGCSSIYGGTFPSVPYTTTKEGKGPAWANSLFEDNAEYGFGMRLSVDFNRNKLLKTINELLKENIPEDLKKLLQESTDQWKDTSTIAKQRAEKIKKLLPEAVKNSTGKQKELLQTILQLQDYFIDKSVWAIGGDGWAYDIDFGGLDHVLASGKNINIFVLDTEGYSNTGGQASKATPLGAVAKFATGGKETPKKNLGLMMMSYENIYAASVNIGANRNQLIKAIEEAERYDGPSIIIAYANCISHGIDMEKGTELGKKAVDSGYWPLYRYNPDVKKEGKNPFTWESPEKSIAFTDYILQEKRYTILQNQSPERAERLYKIAEDSSEKRREQLKRMESKL